MRTSLTRIQRIEGFLSGSISHENKIVFDAHLVLDKDLPGDISSQQQAYKIIRAYSRQALRFELETLHAQLQDDSKLKSFWQRIHQIFQKN